MAKVSIGIPAIGIDPQQLRQYVIEPTLAHLAQWEPRINSEAAIRLLLMTAAHESRMGRYLHQVKGPALGIYQMEGATHGDLWDWMNTPSHGELMIAVESLRSVETRFEYEKDSLELCWNLKYATAMARLYYWRVRKPLPEAEDIEGLAAYAKEFWNTFLGKASIADYANAARDWQIA